MAVSKHRVGRVWYLSYYIDGRQHRKSTRTENEKLAESLRAKKEAEILLGIPAQGANARDGRLDELFRRYLIHSEKTKARTTYKTEYKQLKVWREYFARKAIVKPSQIDPGAIALWQSETELSHRSQNNLITILKTVLNRAVEWNLLDRNPIYKYKRIKLARRPKAFSLEDLAALRRRATPLEKVIIFLGAWQGLRQGEMRHLRWADIDFKGMMLRVRSDEEFTPKGKRARAIPLHIDTAEALKAIKPGPGQGKPGLVFPGRYGPEDVGGHDWISVQFRDLLKRAGIKGSLHGLRHTFGTRLVAEGVPLPVVRDLMGHADIASTMIYVDTYPEQQRDAIDRL